MVDRKAFEESVRRCRDMKPCAPDTDVINAFSKKYPEARIPIERNDPNRYSPHHYKSFILPDGSFHPVPSHPDSSRFPAADKAQPFGYPKWSNGFSRTTKFQILANAIRLNVIDPPDAKEVEIDIDIECCPTDEQINTINSVIVKHKVAARKPVRVILDREVGKLEANLVKRSHEWDGIVRNAYEVPYFCKLSGRSDCPKEKR